MRAALRRVSADLLALLVISGVAMALVLSGADVGPLRAICGLVTVLWTTGYAVTVILYPRRGSLEVWHRLTFTVATSIALTAIVGLGLNATHYGLQPRSWTIAEGSLAAVLVVGALSRRVVQRETERSTTDNGPRRAMRPVTATLLVVAASVAIAAIGFARHDAADIDRSAGATGLWMLPVTTQSGPQLQVGITHEGNDVGRYRLILTQGAQVIHTWPQLTVQAGGNWQSTVPAAGINLNERIRAVLYERNGTRFRMVQFNPSGRSAT